MEVGIVGDELVDILQPSNKSKAISKIFELLDRMKDKGATTVYTTLKMGLDRVVLRASKEKGLVVVAFSDIYTEMKYTDLILVADEAYIADFVDYLVVIDTGQESTRFNRMMKYMNENIIYVNYMTGEEKFGSYTSLKTG